MDTKQPTASSIDAAAPSLLSIFHEDVLLCILGFVADVPFEVGPSDDCELVVADYWHLQLAIGCYFQDK
jgi:hypothetical protein